MTPRSLLACIVVMLFAVACSRNGRVIPRNVMEDIYEDMFLADQWLSDNYQARRMADTTFFYEPIFEKHGYTFKDYDKSVTHYLKDPEKFSKMLKNVSVRLKNRGTELEKIKEAIDNFRLPGGYTPKEFTADSLCWADSLVLWLAKDSTEAVHLPDSLLTALPDTLVHPMDTISIQ